jgi:nitroimidazol reductase NimA-like FMN-containing flavoprotein (pyridoxamine 5'-phosphate oxidase superfamily)
MSKMITSEIENYLIQAKIPLRLSVLTESGWPLILSLWYTYTNGKILLATPNKAKVVKFLRKNQKCAFEISNEKPPYCGIRGQAKAKIIESKGNQVLEMLLQRYMKEGKRSPLARRLLSRKDEEVAIELTPINLFTWNFNDRMKDSKAFQPQYICP